MDDPSLLDLGDTSTLSSMVFTTQDGRWVTVFQIGLCKHAEAGFTEASWPRGFDAEVDATAASLGAGEMRSVYATLAG